MSQEAHSNRNHICQCLHFSEEYLRKSEIVTNVECPVTNCNEIFSQCSALNLHLEKVHRIFLKNDKSEYVVTQAKSKKQKTEENCECEYYCPISSCKYGSLGKRTLPTFHSLKVHFIRIHGDKRHKCSRCNKKFSIKSEMDRHERNCGQLIRCEICNINYSTQQSYQKHCIKKGHKIENNFIQAYIVQKTDQNKSRPKIALPPNRPNNNLLINQPITFRGNHIPLLLIPVHTSATILSTSSLPQTVTQLSNPETTIVTELDHQRSLGCQTNIITQETGSQTKKDEINQTQTQTTTTYASTSTSTSTSTSNFQMCTSVDEYLDAATSTSPLIDDIEFFLNDISTQTINPQTNLDQYRSISIQTTYDSNNCELFASSGAPTHHMTTVDTMTTTDANEYDNLQEDYYFDIDKCAMDNGCQLDQNQQTSAKSTMTSFNYNGCLNKSIGNRCITPTMCNAPSQTEDLYFNTNSIQTQTNVGNGVETQTELAFD